MRRAEYLVVTHPAFEAQAERIAALKESEGRKAAVLNVERAYDRYTGGIVEAAALKALFHELAGAGPLRYVLLLGDDTFDPQDFMGMGLESFVPSLYAWDGQFGRVPSENLYADVDGDGSPGCWRSAACRRRTRRRPRRWPTRSRARPTRCCAATRRHLLGVDNDSQPVAFRALADAVAAGLPPGSTVTMADSGQGVPQARAILLAGLAQGQLVTHVFGHGGPEQWTDEALATVEDIEGLEGTPGEGVVLQWACESQWYQYPLGSSDRRGADAADAGRRRGQLRPWRHHGRGPAGGVLPAPVRGSCSSPSLTLGEAIRRAKAALVADPLTRPVVEGWNLLGDPALRLPPQ